MGKTSRKNRPLQPAKVEEREKAAKPKGRLLAIEGTRGRDLDEAADGLVDTLGGESAGVARSCWDASNTFFELRLGKAKDIRPPARTVLLLYAADLLFRLRWEIRPALEEGHTIVAAPYLDTAVAFGLACGVSKDWLDELFHFAPKPDFTFRLKEKVKAGKKTKAVKNGKNGKALKSAHGFVEFSNALLGTNSRSWNSTQVNAAILKHFDGLEHRSEILRLRKKALKVLTKG